MWLATQLCKKRLISAVQLFEALDEHLSSRPQLGEIAAETKTLEMKEIFKILAAQADDDRPFGQIAKQLGLLDETKLIWLLHEQAQRAKSVESILIEKGAVTAEIVEQERMSVRIQCSEMDSPLNQLTRQSGQEARGH